MREPLNILLVENNEAEADLVKIKLDSIPVVNNILWAPDTETALEMLNEKKIKIVLLDYDLGVLQSKQYSFADEVVSRKIPLVYLSGMNDPAKVIKSYERGACCWLEKPLDVDQFFSVIQGIRSLGVEIVEI